MILLALICLFVFFLLQLVDLVVAEPRPIRLALLILTLIAIVWVGLRGHIG